MKNLKTVFSPKSGVWHLFVDDFEHVPHYPYLTLCGAAGGFNARYIDTDNGDRFRKAENVTCKNCLRSVGKPK